MENRQQTGDSSSPSKRRSPTVASSLADLLVPFLGLTLFFVLTGYLFVAWVRHRDTVRMHHLDERWCLRIEGVNVDYCLYTQADCEASRDARVTARGRRGPWPGPCRHVEPPWCFSLRVRDPDGRHRVAYSCGATYEGCVRNRDRILTTPDDKRAERGYPEPTGYCLQH